MASVVIKNWDNKTWLSSQNYINSFNNFLIKNTKINSNFRILDIGCGRGKILGSLKSRLKLKYKPLGIDIVNHKDRDKRIKFKKANILNLSLRKSQKFDLIMIKQTIHLIKLSKLKKLGAYKHSGFWQCVDTIRDKEILEQAIKKKFYK